jgi:hypothetical protein
MKNIVLCFAICITLCGCGLFKDNYKYTIMYKIHYKYHNINIKDSSPKDCFLCIKEKQKQKSNDFVILSF